MNFLFLCLTYALSIVALWSLMMWWTDEQNTRAQRCLFFVSLGLGPLVIARLLAAVMVWNSGQASSYYIGFVLLALFLSGLPGYSSFRRFITEQLDFSALRTALWGRDFLFTWITLFLIGLLILGAWALPLFANDPLQYAQAARIIFEEQNMGLYPFVDGAKSGGFYGPWTHPPGFVSLLVWSNLIQGHAQIPGLIRFPSVYFSIATVALLWHLGGRRGGALSALFLLAVPRFFESGVICHIDSPRVFGVLAAVALIQLCLTKPSYQYMVLVGIAMGLGMYVHAIGILLIPLGAVIFIHHGSGHFSKRCFMFSMAVLVAVSIVLPAYLANIKNTGALVADSPLVWQLEKLDYTRSMNAARKLGSPLQKVVFGVAKGWTKPRSYSLTYWAFLVALLIYLRELKNEFGLRRSLRLLVRRVLRRLDLLSLCSNWAVISLVIVGAYFGMTVLSVALGMDAFIKNDRYPLTVQPFYALFTGWVFGRWIYGDSVIDRAELEKLEAQDV